MALINSIQEKDKPHPGSGWGFILIQEVF